VTCSPYRYRIDLVRQLSFTEGPGPAVMGVATLNNKIFVVYAELTFIVVYQSHEPYTRLADIPIDGLKKPFDIAAGCSCLYVSDPRSDTIWRVKADDAGVDRWLSGAGAMGVSVAAEEKLVLLVAVDAKGSWEERSLNNAGEIHIYSAGQ